MKAVCRLGARMAEALAFAHARGVLHCDIKPANILLTPYGRPMLADFNVAFDRVRRPDGKPGGTLLYMAPEQVTGKTIDHRVDVYALGTVLYRVITGSTPFAARDFEDLSKKISQSPAATLPERKT